jgi:hypothetical protein
MLESVDGDGPPLSVRQEAHPDPLPRGKAEVETFTGCEIKDPKSSGAMPHESVLMRGASAVCCLSPSMAEKRLCHKSPSIRVGRRAQERKRLKGELVVYGAFLALAVKKREFVQVKRRYERSERERCQDGQEQARTLGMAFQDVSPFGLRCSLGGLAPRYNAAPTQTVVAVRRHEAVAASTPCAGAWCPTEPTPRTTATV